MQNKLYKPEKSRSILNWLGYFLSRHGDEQKQSQASRGNQDSDESKRHVKDTCKQKKFIKENKWEKMWRDR